MIGVALAIASCGGAPSRPGLMAAAAKSEIGVSELRAIDYEFASRFGQRVAKCVDRIFTDGNVEGVAAQREALQWRIFASEQSRSAAFNQDPLAGLLELWALAGQQDEYFRLGDGREFANRHECVASTAARLRSDARNVAASVLGDDRFQEFEKRVDGWIDTHPIEGQLFVRPTAQAELAALVGADLKGGLKAVGSMDETLRDVNDRIAILSVQLPTEARWQADYLVHELFAEHLEGPTKSVTESMTGIAAFLEEFDTSLQSQTTRLLEGFARGRDVVFESLETERARTIESLQSAKASVFDAIDTEVDEAVERFEEAGLGLIDHFFDRLVGVLIAIGVFIFVMVLILVGALRRRPEPRTPPTPPPAPPRGTEN
ncbi:MAG: hypothetical protein WBG86_18320 [Polyangiales bacterium]